VVFGPHCAVGCRAVGLLSALAFRGNKAPPASRMISIANGLRAEGSADPSDGRAAGADRGRAGQLRAGPHGGSDCWRCASGATHVLIGTSRWPEPWIRSW